MKEALKIIIPVVLVVAVVIFVVIRLVMSKVRGGVMDGDGMINVNAVDEVYYSYGGGDLNDSYILDLKEDGRLRLYECEGNGCDEFETIYRVDEKVYSDIADVVCDYRMRKWGAFAKSDEYELDGPTSYYCITYADGGELKVGAQDILPDGGNEALRKIVNILKAAAADEKTEVISRKVRRRGEEEYRDLKE